MDLSLFETIVNMSDEFTVHINLNEVDQVLTFTLGRTVTLEWVKNQMRSSFSVMGGTLSSGRDPNCIQVVSSLTAGSVYYFLGFQQPVPSACKY